MGHPHEEILRDLYAKFAQGDIVGFLEGCDDEVTFAVPGNAAVSGTFSKATFTELLAPVMERSGGTFQEDVLDVFANEEHGVLLLHHHFERDGRPRSYQTAHIVTFNGNKIASWVEHPGSMHEFTDAWGAP